MFVFQKMLSVVDVPRCRANDPVLNHESDQSLASGGSNHDFREL